MHPHTGAKRRISHRQDVTENCAALTHRTLTAYSALQPQLPCGGRTVWYKFHRVPNSAGTIESRRENSKSRGAREMNECE